MKKYLLTTFLVGTFTAGISVSCFAETLGDAVAFAVQNHPSVMAAQSGRNASAETVTEEKSAYYPVINMNASFGRVYADNTTTRGLSVTRGAGYSWYGEGRTALNQKLYDWSATDHRVAAAKSRYYAADLSVEDKRQAIEFQTTQAYIQTLLAQTLKNKAENHLSLMKTYEGRIETLVDEGGADDSALSRAQDIVLLAENSLIQAETDLAVALASYAEAVGRPPVNGLVEPALSMDTMPPDIDTATSVALQNHPQIIAAQYDVKAAHYDKRAEQINLYPQFDAELSYGERDQRDLIGGESTDARALVKVNWDFAVGGAQKAAQRRAAEIEREATYIVDGLKRTVERDVRVAWSSLDLAKRQKMNEADRLAAARETLDTYNEQFEGGQKTLLDIMSAEMQVFNADYSYTNMVYRELDAAYALRIIVGQTASAPAHVTEG